MPDQPDALAALRTRAFELADTGRYGDWASLSADLVDEGAADVIVRRLTHDGLFQIMLSARLSTIRDQ